MNTPEILERPGMEYPECVVVPDFEDAILGIADGWFAKGSRGPVDEEGAEEYMDFNVTGTAAGELTPVFLHMWR